MMVETLLDSPQDFAGMSGGVPQWKRELLQRRAARPRPAPPAPPPPPPAPPPPDDEELRYGPGIVKRLQCRYLSLALRDAPRRRASVLRRAASLEHLLEPPAPPAPRPRPASHHAHLTPPAPHAPPAARRDSIKRARSVDALSRFDRRAPEPAPAPPSTPAPAEPVTPPVTTSAAPVHVPPPLPPPAPPALRAGRPPRRPQPLLRTEERPPAELVRCALRRFEGGARRAAPAARVAAVLRGLEPPPRTSTPEPRPRPASPGPAAEAAAEAGPRPVSRAALDSIARAGSSVLFSFPAPRTGAQPPPPLAAAPPALVPRRVGVIRPLPPAAPPPPPPLPGDDVTDKAPPRLVSPPPPPAPDKKPVAVEASPLSPLPERRDEPALWETPEPGPRAEARNEPLLNGYKEKGEARLNGTLSPCRAASPPAPAAAPPGAWARRRSPGRTPGAAAGATSVVFNFSARAAVPDYIENDGIILRAGRRDKLKAGDPGVVVVGGVTRYHSDSDSGEECGAGGEVEPLSVRFVNDNVLINGRSSLAARRQRQDKLKLQFDDSLTRTFEYPSESSLCEEDPSRPAPAPAPAITPAGAPAIAQAILAANTHIASAALSGYTPSKTLADAFQLGVTRHVALASVAHAALITEQEPVEEETLGGSSWSEARQGHTDLLF